MFSSTLWLHSMEGEGYIKGKKTEGGQEEGEKKGKTKGRNEEESEEGKKESKGFNVHSFIHSFIHSFNGQVLSGTQHGVAGKSQAGVRMPGLLPHLHHAHPGWPCVSHFPSLCLICKWRWSLNLPWL